MRWHASRISRWRPWSRNRTGPGDAHCRCRRRRSNKPPGSASCRCRGAERARGRGIHRAHLSRVKFDLIAVAAYGQILPKAILELPRFGCLNVHTSLLPKYRGAAPIQWAILNDELETGVTIMRMDAGLDTGDILTQAATPIHAEDDAQTLHDRLGQIGAELLASTIRDHVAGKITPRPQPAAGASHASEARKRGRPAGLEANPRVHCGKPVFVL